MLRLLLLHGLSALVTCQTLIMNFTSGLLPQDIYLIDLSVVVKNFSDSAAFNPSNCEVSKTSAADTNLYELVAQDGSKLIGDAGKLRYLKVAADSKPGTFQYKIECTVAGKVRSVIGAVSVENQTAVKTNQTTEVKLFMTAAAFDEYRFSRQELWYQLAQVRGNNLQGKLDPQPLASLGQSAFYTKVPTLYDILNSLPTDLHAIKLAKAFFLRSCGTGPSNLTGHCLLGVREDRRTVVLFRYVPSRSYWAKSGEKQLSIGDSSLFEGCFGWPLGNATDVLCYYTETSSNTSIISFNGNQNQSLEYKITGMRHLSANLLCFRLVSGNSSRAACIDDKYSTVGSFSGLFNQSVERFKLRSSNIELHAALSGCFIEAADFFASPFRLDSFGLICQGKQYFGNFDVKSLEQAKAHPLNLAELPVSSANTFSSQATVETFLCANQHHSIFYSKTASSWKIMYLSMKKPGQQLAVDMDLGPLVSVDQVHCSEAGADFVANLKDGAYFVSMDGLDREAPDLQRVNKIEYLQPNHSPSVAINGWSGLIFDPQSKPVMLPTNFREFNRDGIKQLMLKYLSGYQQLMNTTLQISNPSATRDFKPITFWFEQGDQYPSIKLKPDKKLPKDLPRINLLDYFDLKGSILTVNIEASEHDIKMTYMPVVQESLAETTNANLATLPKMVLGEFIVNLQNLTYFKTKAEERNISHPGVVLNQSYLLGSLTGDLAVICSDTRQQLQFVWVNKEAAVVLSRLITLDVPVVADLSLDASALQVLEPNKSFRLDVPALKPSDSYQRIVIDITRNDADGNYEFSSASYVPYQTDRNPTQQDVASLESYRLTLLHAPDPASNLCLRLILEGGLLLVPFEYRVCNHRLPLNHLFKLRRLTKINTTDVELDLFASSPSPLEGDSVYELKIKATLFSDSGPRVPEAVIWELVSSKRWRNSFGGQVLAFIQNGNSTIILTRNKRGPGNFVVSFFLREVLVSSWEETVAGPGGLIPGKYDGRDCIISKVVIRCVTVTDPVMVLPETMLTDFHTHLYFHVNRGLPSEVRIPILSILEATKPEHPPSPISLGLVVWIVLLVLLCALILVLVYLLKREIVKKNENFGTGTTDETLTEL